VKLEDFHEWPVGKDLEGSYSALLQRVLIVDSGETEKNHESLVSIAGRKPQKVSVR
jgi:hypothetical protein